MQFEVAPLKTRLGCSALTKSSDISIRLKHLKPAGNGSEFCSSSVVLALVNSRKSRAVAPKIDRIYTVAEQDLETA